MTESLEKWTGSVPNPHDPAVRLVGILFLSNEAEAASDPFERRMRLNELQAAIQAAKSDIEAMAEGLIFGGDG